ncbi:Astra associated protein 1 Asa1 [Pestalotiopsis sp. IQ-011]
MASQSEPATPKSVLRGHQAQVHATAFVRNNQRLASGDADGHVVLWDLTIMRPRAVWRAHTNAILGIASWGDDKIITHGRDHRLIVWNISENNESRMSTTLPLDPVPEERPQPWILHILEVNTMNFCSFGRCSASPGEGTDDILIAVPNTLASESVDIWKLPAQERLYTVHGTEKGDKSGMVMALDLFHIGSSLVLVTAYENGLSTVFQQDTDGTWNLVYRAQSHSQPVLSLAVAPSKDYFLTSSADTLLVRHPIPKPAVETPVTIDTAPSASAEKPPPTVGSGKSLLSAALAAEPRPPVAARKTPREVQTQPLKILDTKHSGQQSLQIRSDGRIFATAGWDSKIRVYSAKTMKELAVLKWHQVGCYTVAFTDADVSAAPDRNGVDRGELNGEGTVALSSADTTVKERRIKQANEAHWLAAGSKDGKISLWDIY